MNLTVFTLNASPLWIPDYVHSDSVLYNLRIDAAACRHWWVTAVSFSVKITPSPVIRPELVPPVVISDSWHSSLGHTQPTLLAVVTGWLAEIKSKVSTTQIVLLYGSLPKHKLQVVSQKKTKFNGYQIVILESIITYSMCDVIFDVWRTIRCLISTSEYAYHLLIWTVWVVTRVRW